MMDATEAGRRVAEATRLYFDGPLAEFPTKCAELFGSFNVARVFRLAGYKGKETLLEVSRRERIRFERTSMEYLEERGLEVSVNDLIAYIVEKIP